MTMDNVETPGASESDNRATVYDGLSVELIPAPFWKRFFAYSVDLAVVSAILYVFFFVGLALAGGSAVLVAGFKLQSSFESNPVLTVILVAILLFVAFSVFAVIYHGYFVYFEFKRGMTPGKKLFGLKVVSLKAPQLTFGQCVLRDLFRYVDASLLVPGVISILASQRKQRIGDFAASTLVVYSASREESQDFLYVSQADYQYLLAFYSPLQVPAETCQRYLSYAYPEFILNRRVGDPELQSAWEQAALNYLPGAGTQPQDQRTVLLFFAELCARTLNESGQRR